MGTPDFGIPSLELILKEHNLMGVFCQPDKINGRNNQVSFCPVKQFAVNNNVPVYQPMTFKDNACLDILKEINPDIIIVAAYGKILPKYVLDFPKDGCINIHFKKCKAHSGDANNNAIDKIVSYKNIEKILGIIE